MKTVVLGMGPKVATPEKMQKARSIVSKMEGNTYFSDPSPTLAAVAEAINALETAYEAALDGSRPAKVELRECESVFNGLMKRLAVYVQHVSEGNEKIIVSSGFEAKRTPSTPVEPTNPSNVRGKATIHSGEVIVRWDKANGARVYTTEVCADGTTWTPCGVSTKTSLVVSGLLSGSKPRFRIAAIGPTGQSGWSEPGAVFVH
jgi:hypothetical protein